MNYCNTCLHFEFVNDDFQRGMFCTNKIFIEKIAHHHNGDPVFVPYDFGCVLWKSRTGDQKEDKTSRFELMDIEKDK